MSIEEPPRDAIAGAEQEKSLPTTQDLKSQMEELRARVEAARSQKEKDIEQKVADREALIGEAKSNAELLAQSSETLDYFGSMQELGELKDEDANKLEELKALVASLEQKRLEIDQKINVISSRPEILEKLQDSAKKEDTERAVSNLIDQGRKELGSKVDLIVQDMEVFVERYGAHKENERRDRSDVEKIRREAKTIVDDVKEKLDVRKSDLPNGLDEDWRASNGTLPEFRQRLTERRRSLGMFKGKEKAAIDSILNRLPSVESRLEQALQKLNATEEQIKKDEDDRSRTEAAFRGVVAGSWAIQDKLLELTGEKTAQNQLAWDLKRRVQDRMEELASLERTVKQGEQWTRVGKHNGWFEANRADPKNDRYYNWYNLANKVDSYTDPRKADSGG